jgi:sec-independent protein translocase protein TatA
MNPLLAILGMGNSELLLVLAIVVLLFGATKLPKLARSMGQSVNEFKKGMNEGKDDVPPAESPEKK